MAQAAAHATCLPRELSFKHTVQLWVAWGHYARSIDDGVYEDHWVLIAQQYVGDRPGRVEPRAVKRRPKPYSLLTQPRPVARAHARLYGHPKKPK